MRRTVPLLVLFAAAAAACGDALTTAPSSAVSDPRLAVDPGGTTASILVRGASYGPNREEVVPSSCSGLYALKHDSTDVDVSTTGTWWVHSWKNEKVGCAITSSNAGANIVGGEISVYVENQGTRHSGGVIKADVAERMELENIPVGASIEMTAAPWSGYRFLYWTVTRPDGTGYRDFNATITRSANTSELEYFAEFQASSGGGSTGGGGGDDTCDDPTMPGCEGGN